MSIQEESSRMLTNVSSSSFEAHNQSGRTNTSCNSSLKDSTAGLRANLERFSFESADMCTSSETKNDEEIIHKSLQRQRACTVIYDNRKSRSAALDEERKTTDILQKRIFRIRSLDSPKTKQLHRDSKKPFELYKRQKSIPEPASQNSGMPFSAGDVWNKRESDRCRLEATRLVVLGAGAVGKSSLVRQLVEGSVPDRYKPTLQDSYTHLIQLPGGVFRTIEIVDTAGIYQFPAMRRLSIQSAQALVVVYAVDDVTSFHEALALVDLIKDVKGKQEAEEGQVWPIIVVGNKCDLSTRLLDKCYAEQKVLEKHCIFIEASAKVNENVKQLFAELLLAFYGIESFAGFEHDNCISKTSQLQKNRLHKKCSIL